MNKIEAGMLLTRVLTLWPHAEYTEGLTEAAWADEFKNESFADVSAAVSLYVRRAGNNYAPTPAVLFHYLGEIKKDKAQRLRPDRRIVRRLPAPEKPSADTLRAFRRAAAIKLGIKEWLP